MILLNVADVFVVVAGAGVDVVDTNVVVDVGFVYVDVVVVDFDSDVDTVFDVVVAC